jgi:uncharacterized iron-regulated protein
VRRRALAGLAALAGVPWLAGCAALRQSAGAAAAPRVAVPSALVRALRATQPPALLALGEVHDHAGLHRLRLDWLRELAAAVPRFAIALEQFDASRQDELDAARATGAAEPRALARAGGFDFDGWTWSYYEPVIALALARGLPLVGANLPMAEVAAIARGVRAGGEPPPGWTPSDERAQQRLLDDGHCGLMPPAALAPMARAQRARDAAMAQALARAAAAHRMPVVLLAGNGHVRRDLGVPRFLAAAGHAGTTLAVGFVEETAGTGEAGADGLGLYDWRVALPATPRPDPCEALRERFRRPR